LPLAPGRVAGAVPCGGFLFNPFGSGHRPPWACCKGPSAIEFQNYVSQRANPRRLLLVGGIAGPVPGNQVSYQFPVSFPGARPCQSIPRVRLIEAGGGPIDGWARARGRRLSGEHHVFPRLLVAPPAFFLLVDQTILLWPFPSATLRAVGVRRAALGPKGRDPGPRGPPTILVYKGSTNDGLPAAQDLGRGLPPRAQVGRGPLMGGVVDPGWTLSCSSAFIEPGRCAITDGREPAPNRVVYQPHLRG